MSNERALQNATAPGIALQHTIAGEHVGGIGGVTHAHGDVQPAGLHSTAPYRPPKRRHRDNPDLLLCSAEDCRAYPIKGTGYCAGHSKSLGLVNWPKGGRHKSKGGNDDDIGTTETVGSAADGDDAG